MADHKGTIAVLGFTDPPAGVTVQVFPMGQTYGGAVAGLMFSDPPAGVTVQVFPLGQNHAGMAFVGVPGEGGPEGVAFDFAYVAVEDTNDEPPNGGEEPSDVLPCIVHHRYMMVGSN